jgi:hypothetical protein
LTELATVITTKTIPINNNTPTCSIEAPLIV